MFDRRPPTSATSSTSIRPGWPSCARCSSGREAVTDLAETFRTLGDPTRVRILDALSHGELCVCDLAALVRMSESAVSHQLRLLRSLRLVRPRREGRMVFYALDDQHIITLFRTGLRHVQEAGGRAAQPRQRRTR